MDDVDAYARDIAMSIPLREPVVREAIRALDLPAGSFGLDVGCGPGHLTLLLAEAVGPQGRLVGIDLSPSFVSLAKELSVNARVDSRVTFCQGNASRLPFENDYFDWAWSMDCVGYHPSNPMPALGEMRRVVKPGGTVALVAWSSQMLLPGFPRLEAVLNVTRAGLAPSYAQQKPEESFLRALGWFRSLGLKNPEARAVVGSVAAPLEEDQRAALVSLISMRWQGAQGELSDKDRELFETICDPESVDLIVDHPDYTAFFTNSIFWATV